jgi:mono/diheme cytochrome c family protein
MNTRIYAAIMVAALAWAQDESRSVWDGVYTADQAKRGQAQYQQHCASCHGVSLTGGEMSPALAGGEFLANWNGLTAGDLFERIRKTMPQNKPGKLNREVNAEILAYLLAFNKFPESQTELSSNTEFLKQIRIEADKPEK